MSPVATMLDDSRGSYNAQPGNSFSSNISQPPDILAKMPDEFLQQKTQRTRQSQYSIPGILHFIQHEWSKFEMERAQWDVERAELQAKIAFLQGERQGQENLKKDLIRRVKMLEYALKQERAKYHKLKFGSDLVIAEDKNITNNQASVTEDANKAGGDALAVSENATWRQGRHLLRQYLQEIGYTDTIINVRSERVRAMLGLQRGNAVLQENTSPVGEQAVKRASESQGGRQPGKKSTSDSVASDAENSVLATFDFLKTVCNEEDDVDDSDDMDGDHFHGKMNGSGAGPDGMDDDDDDDDNDADTEEALAEFDFLGAENGDESKSSSSEEWNMPEHMISKLKEQYKSERKAVARKSQQRLKRSNLQSMISSLQNEEDDLDVMPRIGAVTYDELEDAVLSGDAGHLLTNGDDLSLGDLRDLTVSNDAEPLDYDLSTCKDALRKTWVVRYTLRSHFDSVRSLAFHPTEPVIITGSEDHTLKLWNLARTVAAKKAAALDVEPIYTFRGHSSAVLCLVLDSTGDECYSAGLDGSIYCWNVPGSDSDPYDSYSPDVLSTVIPAAHDDAIWSLALHPTQSRLLSAGADGLVKLWHLGEDMKEPSQVYRDEKDVGSPTSIDCVNSDLAHIVAAYNSGAVNIYDVETSKLVVRLENNTEADKDASDSSCLINRVICHPTLPITVTGHENRHIKFFDNNSGKLIHSMVAHLDAVTSLAIDPNGLYLLSGSHDSSIRLWNLDSKTCVQEITSHRKKFDDSIYSVAFHPSKPYIASTGADALAKVFV